jgi:outer membrane protease
MKILNWSSGIKAHILTDHTFRSGKGLSFIVINIQSRFVKPSRRSRFGSVLARSVNKNPKFDIFPAGHGPAFDYFYQGAFPKIALGKPGSARLVHDVGKRRINHPVTNKVPNQRMGRRRRKRNLFGGPFTGKQQGSTGEKQNQGLLKNDRLTAPGKNLYSHNMKNIYAFALLVSMFFCCFPAFLGAESAYSFSLSSSFGILYGSSEELVYKYAGDDSLYSELIWDLKPLVYAGAALDFGRTNPWERWGFFAGASVKYGLPLKTGIMEDKDWLDEDEDHLTHYSRHDAWSQGALLSDVSLGVSFPVFNALLLIKPGIRFSYLYFSWNAQDGFTQYSSKNSSGDYDPWNSGLAKTPVSGPGILYSQHWFIFAPVLAAALKLSSRFFLDFYAAATPLIFCAATDDHLVGIDQRKGRQFKDYLSWGFSFEGGAGFAFAPVEKFEIRLDLGLRYISGPRGETYQRTTGVTSSYFYLSSKEGGAGLFIMDAGISAKIRL